MKRKFVTVIKRNRVLKIDIENILMVERKGRKLFVHTAEEVVDYYEKIDNVVPVFGENFYPCLQGCYINFDHIVEMIDGQFIFDNGTKFSVGRANFIRTKQKYIAYLKKYEKNDKKACNFNRINI